ncbi:IAP repeat-containing protein 7-like protein, partial [Dinothrombium tinctorium]
TKMSFKLSESDTKSKLLAAKTFSNFGQSQNFVDIRTMVDKRFTKEGVCLKPAEFEFLLRNIDKEHADYTEGLRRLKILKINNKVVLDLGSYFKSAQIALEPGEIDEIKNIGPTVLNVVLNTHENINGDRVCCAFCQMVVFDWKPDDPVEDHKKHNPRCPFVRGLDVNNKPI